MGGKIEMDDFNLFVNIVINSLPGVQTVISSLANAFMFLRGNSQIVEFEKIKIGKILEAIDGIAKSHELTFTEFAKC